MDAAAIENAGPWRPAPQELLRATACFSLLALAAAALLGAALADRAWFVRHMLVPGTYPLPPREGTLDVLRACVAVLGLALAGSALAARRATWPGVARVAVAALLALAAAEGALHLVRRAERIEWKLGEPDPATGWAFVPGRSIDFGQPGAPRRVNYAVDGQGDRAASTDFVEDPAAPTVVIAGESVAAGHGLEWSETFGAVLGERLHAQVVNAAEGGYATGQAYLKVTRTLRRLRRPILVAMTILPVQLQRNLAADRPHLALHDGALVLEPGRPRPLLLWRLFDEIPLLTERRLQESLALTRAIALAAAGAARGHGARLVFIVPSFGPPRRLDDHPEAFFVHAVLDGLPYALVDIDPSHLIRGEDHPDPAGARQIAEAVLASLPRH